MAVLKLLIHIVFGHSNYIFLDGSNEALKSQFMKILIFVIEEAIDK